MHERHRRAVDRRAAAVVNTAIAGVVVIIGMLVGPAASAAPQTDSDGNLRVGITDGRTPTPVPSPSATSPGGAGGPGSGTGPGGPGTGGPGTGGTGAPGTGAPGTGAPGTGTMTPVDDVTVPPGKQVLFMVSGLTVRGNPSANPLAGGTVSVEITVQNLTSEIVTATAEFHADDIFGNQVAEAPLVQTPDIAPGDSYTIRHGFGEVRMSGIVHAYATITPPDLIGGEAFEPVTRDGWTAIPSWYAIGALLAVAVGLGARAFLKLRGLL